MEPYEFASSLVAELDSLPVPATAPMRRVRRRLSKALLSRDSAYVIEVALAILETSRHRWIAYELIRDHPSAFRSLDRQMLETLGRGLNSWSSVDSFARTLSGPAWREGLITMEPIRDWARSPDRWWRRAALVSTVALNVRSRGGTGDGPATLAICKLLIADRDDMVVKALSWALRELIVHDAEAVRAFITTHDHSLAARVKREVRNKLETGLKSPKKAGLA